MKCLSKLEWSQQEGKEDPKQIEPSNQLQEIVSDDDADHDNDDDNEYLEIDNLVDLAAATMYTEVVDLSEFLSCWTMI